MKMFITRAEILLLIKFSFSPGSSAVASLAVLSSFTFSVSVITQIIYKSHSIAKFQMNSRRGDNSSLFDNLTLCASFMEMIAIHFQVPKRLFFFLVLYKSSSIFILGNRLSTILSLFYRRFHVFLTIAICIYLCFAEKVLFRFLALVSSVIRLEYQTRPVSCAKG